MKTVLIALSLPALALAACTTGANVAPPPAGFDASATQFTGWVRVRGEEFQLYETEVLLNTGGAAPTMPVNGPVKVDVRPDQIRSANDTLFTSGTLTRYSQSLNMVEERPGKLYQKQ